jgi:hypothetical protein
MRKRKKRKISKNEEATYRAREKEKEIVRNV